MQIAKTGLSWVMQLTTKYDAFPWDFEVEWNDDLGPHGPWYRHKVCGSYVMRGGRWCRMDHAKAFVVGPKGELPR